MRLSPRSKLPKAVAPLMTVSQICDGRLFVGFTEVKADVTDKQGRAVCTFVRQPGGLYVAKLKLKAPFGRPALATSNRPDAIL